ncbi:MAG: hypothetical protein Kow00114_39590 [Kiloniellaceae bacterium]
MNKTIQRTAAATALAFAAALTLSACEEEGPAEQLGESIDNSVEELGDAVEDATE